MRFLKGLLIVLCLAIGFGVILWHSGRFQFMDRLMGWFLDIQSFLPSSLTFDQFLIALAVLSLIVLAVTVSVSAVLLVLMRARLVFVHQRELHRTAAVKRELARVHTAHHHRYEAIAGIGRALAKRLDKRLIVQGIVQAAGEVTSVEQADSLVSLWLMNLETDTLRFEIGRHCDETCFTQTEFQPTQPPFVNVIQTQKPLWLPTLPAEGHLVLTRATVARLGSTTGMLVVPLVVESSVLGIVLVFCHPEALTRAEEQPSYYEAMWGELALGLAIALQGELAILDRLTGTHHREYFMKRLIQELDRATRYQFPLTLLMVDIDNFKAVNDTLGHPQGDAVLKIIARILKKEIRAIDLAGRYGGEEFILLLPETGLGEDATSRSGGLVVAERIRTAVEEEFRGFQKPLNLTVSIGMAVRRFPQDRDMDFREFIRLADEQLYRAKTAGKNTVCVASSADAPHA